MTESLMLGILAGVNLIGIALTVVDFVRDQRRKRACTQLVDTALQAVLAAHTKTIARQVIEADSPFSPEIAYLSKVSALLERSQQPMSNKQFKQWQDRVLRLYIDSDCDYNNPQDWF